MNAQEYNFDKMRLNHYVRAINDEWDAIPTISQLQSHVTLLEQDKQTQLENFLAKKFKYYEATHYDIVVCEHWSFHDKAEASRYGLILNKILFTEPDVDDEMLLVGLRLLFTLPMYFKYIKENQIRILIEKLISLTIHKEEPICTHAIKCLQIAAYFCTKTELKLDSFKNIIGLVIDRLLALAQIKEDDSPICVQNLKYQKITNDDDISELKSLDGQFRTFENQELGESLSIISYINIGPISNALSQKFHYMALLNYMALHVDIDYILEKTNLFDLLYLFVDVKKYDSLALRSFSLLIISKYTKNVKFMMKFINTNGLVKICCIPYDFLSELFVSSILFKISENCFFMNLIVKKDKKLAEFIIRYAIDMYVIARSKHSHLFLINSLNSPSYSLIFHSIGGMKEILNSIKKNSWYQGLMAQSLVTIDLPGVYVNNKDTIKYISKILLDHAFLFLKSMAPSSIVNSIPRVDVSNVNFQQFDLILNYFENSGGIRHDVEFFDSILEEGSFKIVVTFLRTMLKLDRKPNIIPENKMEDIRNILYLLRILSIYHKSVDAFSRFVDPYRQQLEQGNNLISFFKSVVEIYPESDFYYELLPSRIYKNLLMFCFTTVQSYQLFMHSPDTNLHEKSNSISNTKLTELLLQNSFIHHIIKLLAVNPEKQLCNDAKIAAIECLLILTNIKSVYEIIFCMKNYIHEKIRLSLIEMIYSENYVKEAFTFYKYSSKIIDIINTRSKQSSVNNTENLENSDPFNNWQIINCINRYCLDETHLESIKFQDEVLIENDVNGEKSSMPSIENVYWLMMKSLMGKIDIYSEDSKEKFENLTKSLSINVKPLNIKNCQQSLIKTNKNRSAFKAFSNVTSHQSPNKTRCIFDAKILNDGNILATNSTGINSVPMKSCTYSHTMSQIHYIDTSYNSELIIGGGIVAGAQIRFVDIWKYDKFDHSQNIKPIQCFNDLSLATMTRDNRIIVGMDRKLMVHMFDVNNGKFIGDFINNNVQSFARINSLQIDESEKMILINEDIFCTRSGKLIHTFQRFNPHISGIFMNKDLNVLINSELWDLRTLNLVDSLDHLNNIEVKTTLNDDILFGRSIRDNFHIYHLGHHQYNWSNFHSFFGKFVALYNSKDFSQLIKYEADDNLIFSNISKDCTSLAVGIHDSTLQSGCHTFKTVSLAY